MTNTTNNITADDVKRIYEKIEKNKKGSFYIDNSKEEDDITPNHVHKEIACFYESVANNGFDKTNLKADAKLAGELIKGLI